MYGEYSLGVFITLASSLAAVIILGCLSRITKLKQLALLFSSVVFLNLTWLAAVLFYYLKPFFPGPLGPNDIIWFEFLIFSLLFVIRFAFLIALLSLIQHILGLTVSKRIRKTALNIMLILSAVWLLSWLEIPLLGSRYIIDQLMILTDFLLFLTAAAAAIYLRRRASRLPQMQYKRAVMHLSAIIIFPMAIGCLKLVIGSSLGTITYILERSLLYVTLVSFNLLCSWWGIRYRRLLSKYHHFDLGIRHLGSDDLAQKYKITPREMEVVELICAGKTNQEIADRLFISVETVKDHNYTIFQKTGVKNRTQLVNLANNLKKDP